MSWLYRYILTEDWPRWKRRGWKKLGPGPLLGGWISVTVRRRAG